MSWEWYFMDYSKLISCYYNFLINFGYNETINSSNIVEYSNDFMIIAVSFNIYSYEVEISFTNNNSDTIYLSEILSYFQIDGYGIYQLGNGNDLSKGLICLSDSLKQVLHRLNSQFDSENIFFAINEKRRIKLAEIDRQADFKRADVYWKEKNYSEVEKIYLKYNDNLPKRYMKRLEYILHIKEDK